MKHFSKSLNLLLILLVLDLAFIVLSLIDTLSNLNFGNFLVQLDGGFAEKYQYLKFIGVSLMSIILWIKRRLSYNMFGLNKIIPNEPNINFLGLRKNFLIFSILAVILSIALLFFKGLFAIYA